MTTVLVLLPALFCGLLFGVSGLVKLGRPAYYTSLIGAWLPLTPAASQGLALALGLFEIVVAVALSLDATRELGAAAAVALLLAYLAALAWQLRRGHTHLACGCGGPPGRQKIHRGLLARNLGLAGVAAMPLLAPDPAPVTPSTFALALGAAMVFQFLYAALEAMPTQTMRPDGRILQGRLR